MKKKTKPKVCLIQVGSFYVLIELMKQKMKKNKQNIKKNTTNGAKPEAT